MNIIEDGVMANSLVIYFSYSLLLLATYGLHLIVIVILDTRIELVTLVFIIR